MYVTIHVCALFFSAILILLSDKEGFAWITGKKEILDRERVATYHFLTWVGLVSLIASGFIIFLPRASYLLSQPLFIIKLLFVAILVVNAVLIGRLMESATTRSFASLSWEERSPLILSGAISFFAWAGAAVMALALFKIFPFS